MSKVAMLILTVGLSVSFGLAQDQELPAGTPTLTLSAEWPEQQQPNNAIHKTRPPRGGTFDVIVVLDSADASLRPNQRIGVEIKASPDLQPVALLINGVAQPQPATRAMSPIAADRTEFRFRYTLPWNVRQAEAEYTFEVTANLPWQYGNLKRAITLEQGISNYQTTFAARLNQLAESPHTRLETIGKSEYGRDMHLLRVTDFSQPLQGKKKFVIIGAYHGTEPSGHESILDFVHELITKPENAHYLRSTILYIVPCMNPDGRAMGVQQHPNGADFDNAYTQPTLIPEAAHVAAVLDRHKDELQGAIGLTTHQWARSFLLLSLSTPSRDGWDAQLMRNVGIRLANEVNIPVHVQLSIPREGEPIRGIRDYMYHTTGIPSFVVETQATGFNIGRQMPAIVQELHMYYAVLDQLTNPTAVQPKARPMVAIDMPADRNYQVMKVKTPPAIDGNLDETVWRHAPAITRFTTGGRRPNDVNLTTVRLVYDDANLYIAYHMTNPQPSDIMPGQPGNIWAQDGADFQFDTNLNRWSYFQFMANTNGAWSSGYWPIPGINDDNTFKPQGVRIAGSQERGVIEMAIPFAAFNNHPLMVDPAIAAPPKPGTVWGANFVRNIPRSSWAATRETTHEPTSFNTITFTEQND